MSASTEAAPSPSLASAAASPGAAVDFARLASFTDGDHELEQELCTLFLDTAEAYLDELGRVLGQAEGAASDVDAKGWSKAESWARTAHGLKGACGNIGAVGLAELAAAAEKGEPDAALLSELEAAFAVTRQRFVQHLA